MLGPNESAVAQKKRDQEYLQREAQLEGLQKTALKIGTSYEEFAYAFGEHKVIGEDADSKLTRFEVNDEPMLVEFRQGKVSSYRIDDKTIERTKADKAAAWAEYERERDMRDAKQAAMQERLSRSVAPITLTAPTTTKCKAGYNNDVVCETR